MLTHYLVRERAAAAALRAAPRRQRGVSRRVLEKAGYEREGLLRAKLRQMGERRDQLLHACINADWKGAVSDPEESS